MSEHATSAFDQVLIINGFTFDAIFGRNHTYIREDGVSVSVSAGLERSVTFYCRDSKIQAGPFNFTDNDLPVMIKDFDRIILSGRSMNLNTRTNIRKLSDGILEPIGYKCCLSGKIETKNSITAENFLKYLYVNNHNVAINIDPFDQVARIQCRFDGLSVVSELFFWPAQDVKSLRAYIDRVCLGRFSIRDAEKKQ